MSEVPASLNSLLAYWSSLAGGTPPERAVLDPRAIKPLLPYLMLVEFEDAPFRVRYRLSGTRIDDWNGYSIVGLYVDDLIARDSTGAMIHIEQCYRHCWRTGEATIDSYEWPSRSGYPLRIWFGMFPLKVDGVIRQCLAIEDFSAFPDRAESFAWPNPISQA